MNKSKVVIITGGAGGIGTNIVKELAKNGYKIILNYNTSENKAKEIQKELKEKEIEIDIFKADITQRNSVNKLIEYTINKYGKIDVLVNNAAISQVKLFTDITEEDWNKMILTNLTSAFHTTQETVKHMINKKQGCVINISSIWGVTGASCEVHYSVAKAGLDGMTKSLAKELGPSNIRVNSIAPGIIDTNMNNHLSEKEKQEISEEIPLGRIGYPQSIANCVKWLIEDDYTTGQIISVNGGWFI